MFQSPLKTVAEKIKPVDSKSSVSSLRFERSSDFKKFISFIKDETKELEKIKLPSATEIKPKSKGSGALGLLGLGLFGLLGSAFGGEGDGKDDKFRIGGASAGSIQPIVPAGFSSLKPRTRDIAKIRTEKTFTRSIDKKRRDRRAKRAKQLRIRRDTLRNFNVEEKMREKSLKIKKKFTPTKVDVSRESELFENLLKKRFKGEIFDDTLQSDLRDINIYSKTGKFPGSNPEVDQLFLDFEDRLRNLDAEGAFKDTDKIVQDIDNLEKVGKFEKYTDEEFADAAERISKTKKDIEKTVNNIKNKLKEQITPNLRIQKNFKFSLFGDKGFSTKDFLDKQFTKIGKNTKGFRNFISKPFQGSNVTSKLKLGSKFLGRVGFGLDFLSLGLASFELYDGFVVGDNIVTALYDLGVAFHNLIEPDKTKLKFFITKSRNKKKNAFIDKKNQKVLEAIQKAQAAKGISDQVLANTRDSQRGGIIPSVKAAVNNPFGITLAPTVFGIKFISEKLYRQ